MSSLPCNHISIAIPFHFFSQSFPKHTPLLPNCFTYITIQHTKLLHIDPSLMASQGRTYKLGGFQVALTLAFFFSLIVLLPQSVSVKGVVGGFVLSDRRKSLDEKKVGIGSKPPSCRNKCMNCRPCTATVVVPNHKTKGFMASSHREEDSYYLLSWKCRCGDKLFQP